MSARLRRPPGIVFVTQLIDPDDPVLGFTVGLVGALAELVPVGVVAGEVRAGAGDVGAEVLSTGRERGWSRLRRGVAFEVAVARLCRRLRPAVLYAHMCPDYVTLSAPVAKVTGTPTILWYTHSADSANLRRAERLADRIVTALPGSYPRTSPKVSAIGHSIDTRRFELHEPRPAPVGRLELVAVGRMSEVKRYPVIVRGVGLARQRGLDVRLVVLGPASAPAERRVLGELERLVDELGLAKAVTFRGGVSPDEVAAAIVGASALVNASRPGQADKVVFEAMACGRPVLASTPVFHALLGDLPLDLRFDDGDHAGLADAIGRLAAAEPAVVRQTGTALRARVVAEHSLTHWAHQVVELAASLSPRRPAARQLDGVASGQVRSPSGNDGAP